LLPSRASPSRRGLGLAPEQDLLENPLLLRKELPPRALAVEQDPPLRLALRIGRHGGDPLGKLERAIAQLVGGTDLGDDAESKRLLRVEHASREAELARDSGAQGGSRGRVARRYADRELRVAERRRLRRDSHV